MNKLRQRRFDKSIKEVMVEKPKPKKTKKAKKKKEVVEDGE
jgi:hypothetical protein